MTQAPTIALEPRPGGARIEALRLALPGLLEGTAGEVLADNDLLTLEALRGKPVELSTPNHGGALTIAMHLLLDAQLEGEGSAFVTVGGATFFPPDAAAIGVDLAALPVITAPDPLQAGRAVSHLLRSGAFGIIVFDLSGAAPTLPQPLLSRLVGLAKRAGTALLILTSKGPGDASLGSIVGLHLEVTRTFLTPEGPFERPRVELTVRAVKDKRRGPGWAQRVVHPAPPEL
jgi:recombination protein RecA